MGFVAVGSTISDSEVEKRAALCFALQSESLGRSDRLRALLRFVCEAELANEHQKLTEYNIAVSALGRQENFSPTDDSAVRSRVYELRQKLERLYTIEAPDYPVRIELPKGGYRPKFLRVTPPEAPAVPAFPVQAPGHSRRTLLMSFATGVLATVLVMVSAGRLWPGWASKAALKTRWSPELKQLWSPMVSGPGSLLISFETRLFVSVGPLIVRDPELESIHEVESSAPVMRVKELFKAPEIFEARNYTDFSVANAMFSFATLLQGQPAEITIKRSKDLTLDELRSKNLILLGKPGAYDALGQTAGVRANFVFQPDRSIRNLHPQAGEAMVYAKTVDPAASGSLAEEYGLITMAPGLVPGQYILTLVGAQSELFWPLALYVTQSEYARELVHHLQLPSGKLPRGYEVLVKADFQSQGPVKIMYVTHRVIEATKK